MLFIWISVPPPISWIWLTRLRALKAVGSLPSISVSVLRPVVLSWPGTSWILIIVVQMRGGGSRACESTQYWGSKSGSRWSGWSRWSGATSSLLTSVKPSIIWRELALLLIFMYSIYCPPRCSALRKEGNCKAAQFPSFFPSFQINSLQLFPELSNSSLQWGFGNFDLRSIFLSERLWYSTLGSFCNSCFGFAQLFRNCNLK